MGDPAVAVVVEEVTAVTADVREAMARLVPQLSRSAPVPTDDELAEIVSSPATMLLAARVVGDDGADGAGRIVGLLTLAVFRIPTGVRAWIEDVVVDQAVRGQGVGEALTREAVRLAAAAGARTVDLTSRPSREAANRLYRRLGFAVRETNVYRYDSGADSTPSPGVNP
jgi:ribosomal protein S18 acetylase RimI-like enzyme